MAYNINNNCLCGKCRVCKKRGPVGDVGDKGPKGNKGSTGEKGFKGPMGDDGDRGDRGETGDTGDKGLKGNKGAKGPRGINGDKGDKGDRGEIGNKGPEGSTGVKGDNGDKGDKGDNGLEGEKGPKGDTGPKGEIGIKGPRGFKGATGDRGPVGIKGRLGEVGDKGPQGDIGPKGIQGINGDVGPVGPRGFFGAPGQCIASPSEVILAKVGEYIADEGLKCYMEINSPRPLITRGIGAISAAEGITDSNLSYFEMESGNIMGVKNIESINIVINRSDIAIRNKIIIDIGEIFAAFYDCQKQSPQTVDINDKGEPVLAGNPVIDYEYTRVCRCSSNICTCIGEKIDICMYQGSKVENLKKIIERARDEGKKINKIVTTKANFTNLVRLGSPISIESISSGGVVLRYEINEAQGFSVISIVALDKIMAIEFTN